jgi:hypothetical protein
MTARPHDTLRDDLAEALAELMAKQRTHGAVYMGGEHNPLPSEMQAARLFVRDVVLPHTDAQVAAERERIAAAIEAELLEGDPWPSERRLRSRAINIARGQP